MLTEDIDATFDAVVIGAGVIGASVTLELARSGRRVLNLDKGTAPGAGSTSASSAIVRFHYSTPDTVLTAWEAASMWSDWSGHLGVEDPAGMARFVETGGVIYQTRGYDASIVRKIWDDVGIPYEVLDTEQLAARFPALDTGSYFPPKLASDPAFADDATEQLSALFNPNCGFIDDPMLAAQNLAFAARTHGALFRFGAEVVEVRRIGRHVTGVRLRSGELVSAPVVVNVAGPHSSRINRLAGVDREMRIQHRPLRQEVYAVPAPVDFRLGSSGAMVADLDLGQYFRPHLGDTILLGGTEPECDPLEWIEDPDDFRDYPTVDRWETAIWRLARRIPTFGVPSRPVGLAALYDASDDWVPIYDRSSLDGYYMACGTSGNQFKNAPIAGQFMRALIDAGDSGINHDDAPVQFKGPTTGRAIDLGAFSRLRDPASTSGTVMG